MFDSGSPDSDEEGGTIYSIHASRRRSSGAVRSCVEITFGPGQLNLKRIKVRSVIMLHDIHLPAQQVLCLCTTAA